LPAAEAEARSDDQRADLALIIDVAREAGRLALQWLQKGARSWDKSPDNPVTEADLAVNDLIHHRLSAARPDYGWLSEETKDDPANRRQARTFVVDPIDGTRAFVRGEPAFTVSIARLEGHRPAAGVVLNPMTNELFAASLGDPATLNGEAIRTTPNDTLDDCRMIGHSDMFAVKAGASPGPAMQFLRPVPSSLAYRLCLVACGRWDAAVRLLPTNDWDIAAAVLILAEAGGKVTDSHGDELRFNRASPIHRGVVAAGASLHPLLLDRLRRNGPQA
jgi:myo-inositol-1(or 4)-monophosphatase